MKNTHIDIVTDVEAFQERNDEILGGEDYNYVKGVVARLKDALYEYKDVSALCAPQIGEKTRIFVVKNGQKDEARFKAFLNPIVVQSKGLHLSREANISFPNKQFIIPRRDEVHVAYQTPEGYVNSESFIGAYAEVVQQMIEMLDGITLFDYGLDLDDVGGAKAFDKAVQKDKAQVLQMYIEQLKQYNTQLAEEVEKDPVLNHMNKTIEFNKGVLLGDIKPIMTKVEDGAE